MMQARSSNTPQPPGVPDGSDESPITVETRFGTVHFGPGNIVYFPQGMIGLPHSRRFGLSPIPDPRMGQFMLLQSLDDFALSFLVLPLQLGPQTVAQEDAAEACAALAVPAEDADFFTVVTLRKGETGLAVSVNLRAPVIVDSKSKIARQYVLANPKYPIRRPL
jgi:flagellar assembly factor FliW